jgi:ArsR family transcriptional regulator
MTDKMALMFKALSDPNRLLILELLLQGETCGCTLIDKLPITQPTLSYHLDILTKAGLTKAYKEGTWKKHTVDQQNLDMIIGYIESLKQMKAVCVK